MNDQQQSDIVTRLRRRGHLESDGAGGSDGHYRPQTFVPDALCTEAAIEIGELRAQVDAVRIAKVSPTTADGLLRLSLAIERLAAAIERHR